MGHQEDDASSASAASKPKPKIHLPPRASMEMFFANGSFSPGPMTLVSSLFPDQTHFSFSQLLVGAMASPLAAPKPPPFAGGFSQDDFDKDKERGLQRNRPPSLVVAPPRQLPENLSPLLLGMSPSGLLNSPVLLSPLQSPFGMSHQQALAHVTAQAALSQSFKQMQSEVQQQELPSSVEASEANPTNTPLENLASFPQEQSLVSSSDHKTASSVGDKPVNDGYNWRKYGQKQVKASECPRSYYKCTHPDCPVRKKVERSIDGRISEITYKGQHNHDLPQPSKRVREHGSMDGTGVSQQRPILPSQEHTEGNRLQGVVSFPSEGSSFQETVQEPFEYGTMPSDFQNNAASVEKEEDMPSAKRRSTEIGQAHQTVMESKIVLKTRSEVDLLDDGYRWRKYGQKVVKGNPYPRSYYRCTYAGCKVRKHVERASTDPKSVITTYEGKHTHDLPLGRSGSHPHPTASTSSQPFKTMPGSGASQSHPVIPEQKPDTLHLKGDEVIA